MKYFDLDDAFELEEQIHQRIMEYAQRESLDEQQLMKLWNTAAEICVDGIGAQRGIVFSLGEKSYSVKGANLVYNQRKLLENVVEIGLTMSKPQGNDEIIKLALYIVYKLGALVSIELNKVQADILVYCHTENMYDRFVSEEDILSAVDGASSSELTTLSNMGCIEILDGKIRLCEKVVLL